MFRRQWRSTYGDSRDMGVTIKCFACLACVDVAVARGLNCQVNCHVVKLEVCMLLPECSERQFVCRLDPQDRESVWNLNIVEDILKCKMDPLQFPGRLFFGARNRGMQLMAFLTFVESVLPRGRLRKRRRCRRKERSAAALELSPSNKPRSRNPGDIGKRLSCEAEGVDHTRVHGNENQSTVARCLK